MNLLKSSFEIIPSYSNLERRDVVVGVAKVERSGACAGVTSYNINLLLLLFIYLFTIIIIIIIIIDRQTDKQREKQRQRE